MDIKISTYDFFNKFILGLVFIEVVILAYIQYAIDYLKELTLNATFDTILIIGTLSLVYEIGIVINRLGSILEELLKCLHLIPFNSDYKKFNDKKKEYPIMNILSREYALSRNSIVLFFLISIIIFIRFGWYGFITVAIMLLFYWSCRRYSSKIVDLMK